MLEEEEEEKRKEIIHFVLKALLLKLKEQQVGV